VRDSYVGGPVISVIYLTTSAGLNGLVRISSAKDASEAPIAVYFGNILCTHMDVQCHPVSLGFIPFNWELRRGEAMAY